MIDLALLRKEPELIRESCRKRGQDAAFLDEILKSDAEFRQHSVELEEKRSRLKTLGKTQASAQENIDQLRQLKEEISSLEEKTNKAKVKRDEKLAFVPNLIDQEVPEGQNAEQNKLLDTWGEIKLKSGLAHDEIMAKMGWLNMETAAQFSGARFRYLLGAGALAQQKLLQIAIKLALDEGFTLAVPPVVAQASTLEATGFFPKGKPDTFKVSEEQYLVGTSEPMLLVLSANQKFNPKDLPRRFTGISTCFRQEAGSSGKDTKGMFRLHQFDKVEMVAIVEPDKSNDELERLVSIQEKLVKMFNLPYRKVLLCAGEQSQTAAKQIDIEVWFPGQERYRETHSASNCTDYQTRGLAIKTIQEDQAVYAHALNATLVTERLLLAIIENNQKADGTIDLPDELKA